MLHRSTVLNALTLFRARSRHFATAMSSRDISFPSFNPSEMIGITYLTATNLTGQALSRLAVSYAGVNPNACNIPTARVAGYPKS